MKVPVRRFVHSGAAKGRVGRGGGGRRHGGAVLVSTGAGQQQQRWWRWRMGSGKAEPPSCAGSRAPQLCSSRQLTGGGPAGVGGQAGLQIRCGSSRGTENAGTTHSGNACCLPRPTPLHILAEHGHITAAVHAPGATSRSRRGGRATSREPPVAFCVHGQWSSITRSEWLTAAVCCKPQQQACWIAGGSGSDRRHHAPLPKAAGWALLSSRAGMPAGCTLPILPGRNVAWPSLFTSSKKGRKMGSKGGKQVGSIGLDSHSGGGRTLTCRAAGGRAEGSLLSGLTVRARSRCVPGAPRVACLSASSRHTTPNFRTCALARQRMGAYPPCFEA